MEVIMSSHHKQELNLPDKKIKVVIIGGLGFSSFEKFDLQSINTPFGNVNVNLGNIGGQNIAVIPRHGEVQNHVPPHMVNYRANIWAAYELGATRIISVNSVGTMKSHTPGTLVLLSDFLDFTKNRVSTFFDNETVHVDVSEPYCPQINKYLSKSIINRCINCFEGVYACTEGPRFETKSEINMLSRFADVVGMTGVPEVVLAKELDMCYASIGLVTNYACGLSFKRFTVDEVIDVVNNVQDLLHDVISDTISSLPVERNCSCMYATYNARI